jgi:O-antigen/teichoic acid export membrane protein
MNTTLVSAAVSIALNLLLIPHIGLWAAAISIFIAYLVASIHRYRDVQKYVALHVNPLLLVSLTIFYLLVCVLYYQENTMLSIVGVVISLVFTLILNRQEIGSIKRLTLEKVHRK